MMFKVILYAYMNNIYSCRKIEKMLLRDIHFIRLAGYEKPDFITINRFRNRVKDELNNMFTQLVVLLAAAPVPKNKEEKAQHKAKEKQIKELDRHREKLNEYDCCLKQIGSRNSMSKTDPEATFMRMKEDAMNN